MQIFIPSLGRWQKQVTLGKLPHHWLSRVTLVVRKDEKKQYAAHHPTMKIAVAPAGIGPTRDWIIANATDPKVLMLDDDLGFYARRKDDPTKFEDMQSGGVDDMLKWVERGLDDYVHLGICPREGGNRVTVDQVNTRLLRMLGYRADVLRKMPFKFSDMRLQEDFYITLSLLQAGYPNIMLSQWCHNQAVGSNAPGGCSTYRTIEVHNKSAQELAAKFPEYVRVVHKQTKTAWGGKARLDCVISWKKAYADRKL